MESRLRLASIVFGAVLFSGLFNGFCGDWRTDSLLVSAIKFVLAGLIWAVVMHFSLKRLER